LRFSPDFIKELRIRTRVVVLALVLAASLAGVGLKIRSVWQEGPWSLPAPVKRKPMALNVEEKEQAKAAPSIVGTEMIIAKNLFDPERGASRTKETEADMRAAQRIRSLILLGTAILGPNRYAIVQDSDASSRPMAGAQPAAQAPRRMKLGDSVDGFSLTEVSERKVVFAKGPMRVEVPVDYFRKVPVTTQPAAQQPGQARSPVQVAPGAIPGQIAPAPGQPVPGAIPRAVPNLPRRPRLPSAPEQ
jgi:hypothetical protein